MKHTRVVSTKCTPGFACRAFSDTTLVCFIVNEQTTKCSRYKIIAWRKALIWTKMAYTPIRKYIYIYVTRPEWIKHNIRCSVLMQNYDITIWLGSSLSPAGDTQTFTSTYDDVMWIRYYRLKLYEIHTGKERCPGKRLHSTILVRIAICLMVYFVFQVSRDPQRTVNKGSWIIQQIYSIRSFPVFIRPAKVARIMVWRGSSVRQHIALFRNNHLLH